MATAHLDPPQERRAPPRKSGRAAGLPVVLIVDGNPEGLAALGAALRRDDVQLLSTSSGRAALEILLERNVAVAIIDLAVPGLDGLELAQRIRGVDPQHRVPIIFLARDARDREQSLSGYDTGAIDFLSKPFDERALKAKVDVLVTLEKQRREVVRALEETEHARAETQLLLHLAQATSRSEKPADVYNPALGAVRELFGAERSSILLFGSGEKMRFVAWRGLSEAYRAAVDGHSPWTRDEKNAQPILIADVDAEPSMEPYRSIFASERIRAIGFVPLVSNRQLLGKFMLYWEHPRAFTEHDRELAEAIATQIAEALERGRLREAERRNLLHLAQLQQVTASLNEVLTPSGVAAACLPAVLEAMGGLGGIIHRVSADGAYLEAVEQTGDPGSAQSQPFRRVPIGPTTASSLAAATGAPVFITSPADYLARFPQHADTAGKYGTRVALPLTIQGEVVGVIGFALPQWRELPDDERAFLVAVASQAAQAFDRARLHEAERRARAEAEAAERRTAFLAMAGAELAASLDYQATLQKVAALAVPSLADWCAVDMVAEGRRLDRLAVVHVDPAKIDLAKRIWRDYPVDPDASVGAPAIIRSGKSQLYPVIDDALLQAGARSPEHLELLRAVGLHSAMAVPIMVGGRAIGLISFVSSDPRRLYGPADLQMAEELALRAAIAIENARTHQALKVADEKLRVALGAGKMGVWEWSLGSNTLAWSPTLEALHGYAPGTFPGTFEAYQKELHPEDRARVLQLIEESVAERRDHQLEYRIVRQDGAVRWVSAHGKLFKDAQGRPATMTGVCMDVTEARSAAEAREATVAALEKALRENELFAGVLAHDLRNPLTAILAAAQLSLRHPEDENVRSGEPLQRIVRSGERMSRMIEQLLDFTRARLGNGFELMPRETDLKALCAQVLGELEVAHPEWQLSLQASGALGGLWDPDRLAQLVSNLLGNAGQHGEPGRPIRLRLDGTAPAAVVLAVHNRGAILAELLPHIFTPFRGSGERSAGGLGLGLYIARAIAESHRGRLEVESSPAAGTTFTLTLPR